MSMHEINDIFVELTDICYLSCRHCSSSASPGGNTILQMDVLHKLLVEGKDMGATCITISGGEPLLYPHIFDLLTQCFELNYKVRIYSSGVLKKENRLVSVSKELIKQISTFKNIDSVIFSLHGSNAETHDYITNTKGSFKIIIESIREANKAGIPFEIHTVPMSINYKQIPDIVQLAESLNVNQVSLLRLVPQGRCLQNKHLVMNQEENLHFLKIIENLSSEVIRKGAPFRCLFLNGADCSAGKDKVLIDPDGAVFPCEAFKSEKGYSNIKNSSLRNIWRLDPRINQIRNLRTSEVSKCNECSSLMECHGGCPGQRQLEYDSIYTGPDPICPNYQ